MTSARSDPQIDRPILLFGVGRTGTTIAMHLLAQHPSLGWFSSFHQKLPRWPALALYSRIVDYPWARPPLPSEWSLMPKPSEGARVVGHLTSDDKRSQAQRRLRAKDASPETIGKYRKYVKAILRYQGKSRFLQKHTGFPRIEYFSAIFPDAKFIHVARDGRAAAYSLTKVHWWDGTMKSWRWGEMAPSFRQEYFAANQEPIVLAAIVWKTIMGFIEEESAQLAEDRYMEVRYDRLISEPVEVMRQICAFCDLPFDREIRSRVATVDLHDADLRWRKELSPHQVELLQSVLGMALKRYGFES